MIDNAIYNDSGQIAIKWALNRPAKTIQMSGTKTYYAPTYAHNVAMYWVNEEDAPSILAQKEKYCNCQNGIYKNAYELANVIDVNLHRCGNRHCED